MLVVTFVPKLLSHSYHSHGTTVTLGILQERFVWSWHIWVTPETLSTQTSIAGNSYTYKVTPVNLGWVSTGKITWVDKSKRSCLVKITQSGGKDATFNVSQTSSQAPTYTASKQGVNTYYQWGRKDPEIPAATYNSESNHAVYDINGNTVTITLKQTSVPIGTTIQNPLIHYYNSTNSGPYDTSQYNLWNANDFNNAIVTIKTIYDPCPPGFCISARGLWYKMSGDFNGKSTTGSWDETNIGRLWDDDSPHVFFPASGYRIAATGHLNLVGYTGYYWSTVIYDIENSPYLYLNRNYWNSYAMSRSYGLPVRAVLEE